MNKFIKFGTNVDLSDSKIWKEQIGEINKLPKWLKLDHHENPLSQGTLNNQRSRSSEVNHTMV